MRFHVVYIPEQRFDCYNLAPDLHNWLKECQRKYVRIFQHILFPEINDRIKEVGHKRSETAREIIFGLSFGRTITE